MLVKIISDAQSSVPAAFINAVDLDGQKQGSIKLSKLLTVHGWYYSTSADFYALIQKGYPAASIHLMKSERKLRTIVFCNNFPTESLKDKCKKSFKTNASGQLITDIFF